jgi:hypothetical protein
MLDEGGRSYWCAHADESVRGKREFSKDWTLFVDQSHTHPGIHNGGGWQYVEIGFGEIDFYSNAVEENSLEVVNIGPRYLRAAITWKSSIIASTSAEIFGYWDKISVPAKWASRLENTEPVPYS